VTDPDRRIVLTGLAAAGLAVPILAGCGSGTDGSVGSGDGQADPGTSGGGTSGGGTSGGGSGGGIKTSEIPVGGGRIFSSRKIVVTQPTAGQFKAFSAVCTHQGCLVSRIASGHIDCTCHGSEYSIEDGSVEVGPAPRALPEKTVTVTGDTLTVS
jgi:Rieske Fe-S protein